MGSNPVHDPIVPGPLLAQLAFVEGDFEGEGRYTDGSGTFRKCSAGRSEVGGRFISLRMQASYSLPDEAWTAIAHWSWSAQPATLAR